MAKIDNAQSLLKILFLSNLDAKKGLFMTPMLNGSHGVGKTQIVSRTAKSLGGVAYTMDGSVLKEGDAVGIPFPRKSEDGTTEVGFIKHNTINKIFRLERFYHEKACGEGFLGGKVRLVTDEKGDEYLIENDKKTLVADKFTKVERGEDNIYKFGDELPFETKLALIESGEIRPVFLFIDELNRAEQQTLKELMNIILNKNVNGYDLPWWVSIVAAVNPSSQNSSYATVELDPAQYSRFCNIKVTADLNDWVDYALREGLNGDVIEAVGLSDKIFIHKESSTEDETVMTPDPRAWEMVAHLYDSIGKISNTKFFTPAEKKNLSDDIHTIIKSKVGENAARIFREAIRNKENNIKPDEIFNGKSSELDPNIKKKFSSMHRISQKVISDSLACYMLSNYNKYAELKKGATQKDKVEFANYQLQLKEFMSLMDLSTQHKFIEKMLENARLYMMFSRAFDREVMAAIEENKKAIFDFNNEGNGSNN